MSSRRRGKGWGKAQAIVKQEEGGRIYPLYPFPPCSSSVQTHTTHIQTFPLLHPQLLYTQYNSLVLNGIEATTTHTCGGCWYSGKCSSLIGRTRRKATNQIWGQRTSGNRIFTPENIRHPLLGGVPLSPFSYSTQSYTCFSVTLQISYLSKRLKEGQYFSLAVL